MRMHASADDPRPLKVNFYLRIFEYSFDVIKSVFCTFYFKMRPNICRIKIKGVFNKDLKVCL